MNNTTLQAIEYLEQFVITDISKLVLVVGVLVVVVGIVLWKTKEKEVKSKW